MVWGYRRKLEQLFKKLFEPNFEICSFYTEELLKFLKEPPDEEAAHIVATPIFSDLVTGAVTNMSRATESVQVFITELVTILASNELQFCKLVSLVGSQTILDQFCNFERASVRLHLAFIKQARARLKHWSGVMWIVDHRVCERLLFSGKLSHQNRKVVQKSNTFIAELVWKLDEVEGDKHLKHIFDIICKPILDSGYHKGVSEPINSDSEKDIVKSLMPVLDLLEVILSQTDKFAKPNQILNLLARYYCLAHNLEFLFEVSRDSQLIIKLAELIFKMWFYIAHEHVAKEEAEKEMQLSVVLYNGLMHTSGKTTVTQLIDYIVHCYTFCAKFESHTLNVGRKVQKYLINQFIVLLTVPIMMQVCIRRENGFAGSNDDREAFISKVMQVSFDHIIKACYMFREASREDSKNNAYYTIRELFRLKDHIKIDQAGILYQSLFHVLQLYVKTDETGQVIPSDELSDSIEDIRLVSVLLEQIAMLLKVHKVHWYKNYEIIWLHTTLVNLLKQKLTTRLTIQTLDLMEIGVRQFIPPDLYLLVDNTSEADDTGGVIKKYMAAEEWEVRDSALQLLNTCVDIAFIKYTPFQKALLRNRSISAAADIALKDSSFYVQSTALKCLAAATKIESIWEELMMDRPQLHNQLFEILSSSPEGMIRKEVANLVTEISINTKTTPEFMYSMYNAMTTAALDDLHWEVQLHALTFWRHTIQTEIARKGMIDGKFPPVTFSKEKRKIINLNPAEIEKQLVSILMELSRIGCLAVLNRCMQNESNIVVVEKSYCIAKNLIAILDRYDLKSVPGNERVSPEMIVIDNEDPVVERPDIDQDDVIDEILRKFQSDLILRIHDDCKAQDITDEEDSKSVLVLHPNEFLKYFRSNNFDEVIESKRIFYAKGPRLDMVLDDILTLDNKIEYVLDV